MTHTPRLTLISVCSCCLAVFCGWAAPASAQLGSRPAADWIRTLEREERVASLRIPEVIERLGLGPGVRVADIGAGPGVFTLPFAKAVGSAPVYAVEVDQALLDHIGTRAREQQITNIRPVLGRFEDPTLPEASVDLAFFHDVLHHIADRPAYLRNLARAIAPGGRIAIIERRAGRAGEMHLTPAEVTAMLADAGFGKAQTIDLFAEKSFVVYSR
ncbi:MAG: class I SAM-dependent methyltransferase [Vicinamibacterales bacterium]